LCVLQEVSADIRKARTIKMTGFIKNKFGIKT
jgi:hypothetical protein